jgi:putative transcriptional regulator
MRKKAFRLKISNRVHVLRAERRITQAQLAEAIGVTRATINALEKGNYNPSLELAFKLSLYFKADIHEIFTVGKSFESPYAKMTLRVQPSEPDNVPLC